VAGEFDPLTSIRVVKFGLRLCNRRRVTEGLDWRPWAFTNWAGGEPSGIYNEVIEDKLQMRGKDDTHLPQPTWNDQGNAGFDNGTLSYVIEFE
jgi:hypothetical protein